MKRIIQKEPNMFMEVDEYKALQYNLKAIGEPLNLTSAEIDDCSMMSLIAEGHCEPFGEAKWFCMNTESVTDAEGKEHYPVQFFGK